MATTRGLFTTGPISTIGGAPATNNTRQRTPTRSTSVDRRVAARNAQAARIKELMAQCDAIAEKIKVVENMIRQYKRQHGVTGNRRQEPGERPIGISLSANDRVTRQ